MFAPHRAGKPPLTLVALLLAILALAAACQGDDAAAPSEDEDAQASSESEETGDEGEGAEDDDAVAADWPQQPVTLALTFPAGGAIDRSLRPIAQVLQNELGTPVSVADMSGSAGAVAADWVQGQPADGYAWIGQAEVIETNALLDQYDHLYSDYWHYVATGAPVTFSVAADSPYESFQDLLDALEADPDSVTVGTVAPGTTHHTGASFVQEVSGIDFPLVVYEGGGPGVRGLVAGEVDALALAPTPKIPFIEAGDIRPLTTLTDEPFQLDAWGSIDPITDYLDSELFERVLPLANIQMIALKRDTPEDVLAILDDAWETAMADEVMNDIVSDNGFLFFGLDREASQELVERRSIFSSWMAEEILGTAERSREELNIPMFEDQ